MLLTVTAANLFPSTVVIHFRPERHTCAACHEALKLQKTNPGKRASTLAIGNFIAHEQCVTALHAHGCFTQRSFGD